MQDSKGYIWVGTEAGAARYDGYKFTFFTMEDGLTDNDVFQIHEDHKGRLWFLTNKGKPCFYENGSIYNANNTLWLQPIQPKKLAKSFLLDTNNSIWFTCLDTVYHLVNDQVKEKITLPPALLNKVNIQLLFKEKDSTYLLHNLGVYNIQSKKDYPFSHAQKINSLHTRVFKRESHVYFILSNELGMFNLQTKQSSSIFSAPLHNGLFTFTTTDNASIMFVSSYEKMYELNIKTNTVTESKTLQQPLVTNIIKDIEGNEWMALFKKGLWIKRKQEVSNTTKIEVNGLPKDIRATVVNKLENNIYFGYEDGNYITKSNNSFKHYTLPLMAMKQPIWQFEQVNGEALIVTASDIIRRVKYKNLYATLSAKQIIQSGNYLYLAGSEGLSKYPLSRFNDFGTIKGSRPISISTKRYITLLAKNTDTIYVGGILGLALFVKDKEVAPFKNSSITQGYVSKIIKINNAAIAFATLNKGIGIIANDSIYTINKINGLLSNACNSIYAVNSNTFWVATSNGVNRIKFTFLPNKSIQYSIEDYTDVLALSSNNINDVLQTNDTLYITTNEGAFYHVLNQQKPHNVIPKIAVQSIQINDSLYQPQSNFELNYLQNKIKINFVGISYIAYKNLKYKYKLLPIDTNWQFTENTFVEYPYLPPGKYQFFITTALPNGTWNPNPVSTELFIKKPFWQTVTFIVSSGLLVLLILFLIIKYIVHNLKQKHVLVSKQLLFEKQLLELEHKALRLQMNPHFIFNAINAIKGYYASGEVANAKNYIGTFSALMRLMLETGNDTSISLNNELCILDYYLQLFALRYENRFKYEIVTNLQTPASQMYIPIMMLQPFVENAVVHGIASIKENGWIKIEMTQKNETLFCTIEDNGIGRKKAATMNAEKIHHSKGIEITEQRLKIIGDKSAISIIDKVDEQGVALGTLVKIDLPLIV
jgi:two-component sensor histidine kinase